MARIVLLLIVALCTGALLVESIPARNAQATFPGANGKIAFVTNRDSNDEIYVMNADGSNATNLTHNNASDVNPSWSPDGSQITFESDRDGNKEIYVMAVGGSDPQRLTTSPLPDTGPVWSPLGTKIVFHRGNFPETEVYAIGADGTGEINLTNHAGKDSLGAWSADGSLVYFVSDRDQALHSDEQVFSVQGDGNAITELTSLEDDLVCCIAPSPDGQRLALVTLGGGNPNVLTMNVNGTGLTSIADAGYDYGPQWSPDGSKIGFYTYIYPPMELYSVRPDGTELRQLTINASFDGDFVWSPDNQRAAFMSDRDGNYEIYTMNSDGTSQTNLTNNLANDISPDWQPLAGVGGDTALVEASPTAVRRARVWPFAAMVVVSGIALIAVAAVRRTFGR